jgi:hypothetical protein
MKKYILASLTAIVFTAYPLFAADNVLIGVKAWYASWDPLYVDVGDSFPETGWQHLETGTGMLYGPSLGFSISDRINLSVSFLFGTLRTQYQKEYTAIPSEDIVEYYYYKIGKAEISRQDLDVALSYNVSQTFKVFAGFKYQPAEIKLKSAGTDWQTAFPVTTDVMRLEYHKFKQQTYGPALGVGFSYPLADVVAFTANLSLLYIMGDSEMVLEGITYTDLPGSVAGSPYENEFDIDISGMGINFEPALVALLKEKVIFVLGFRFQYLRLTAESSYFDTILGSKELDDLNDFYYGFYVSVLYRL